MNYDPAMQEKLKILPRYSQDLHRLTQFLIRKEKHEINFEKGTAEEKETIQAELDYLLKLENKWKRYPSWYICLRGPLRELKEWRSRLSGSPPLEERVAAPEAKVSDLPKKVASGTLENIVDNDADSFEKSEDVKSKNHSQSYLPSKLKEDTLKKDWSVQDINAFYESQGVVGERRARTLLLYGALGRAHLGIESLSGSGKSALLYAFLKTLPTGSFFALKRATDKALFNDPQINNYQFLIATELQKISEGLKEDLKDLAEGVDSTYRRTNSQRNGVDFLSVTAGKVIIYTLAITNDYYKKKDNELSRRFIVLPTEISKEQNQAVVEAYDEREFAQSQSLSTAYPLSEHVGRCLELGYKLRNPFLSYLIEHQPEEIQGNVRYRSFVKYIQSLVQGCTLFHYPQRVVQEKSIFASLEDNHQVMELYGQLFYDNVLGISVVDRLVLDSLELGKSYSEPEAIEKIAQQGFYDKTTVIEDSLQNLCDLRFVKKERDFEKKVNIVEKIKDRSQYKALDWEEALASADKRMQEHYPQLRETWLERCLGKDNTSLSFSTEGG